MTRQRMTRVVVVCVALALASPVAAQGVAVGVGAAASVTSRQGVAVADHGGGYVSLDRLVSPHLSVGGELGLVSGAGTYWESQARGGSASRWAMAPCGPTPSTAWDWGGGIPRPRRRP